MIVRPGLLMLEKRAPALYDVTSPGGDVVLTFFNQRDADRFVRAAGYAREAR